MGKSKNAVAADNPNTNTTPDPNKIYVMKDADGAPVLNGPWIKMPSLYLGTHIEAVTFMYTTMQAQTAGLAICASCAMEFGGDWSQYPIEMPAIQLESLEKTFRDPDVTSKRKHIASARLKFALLLPVGVLKECANHMHDNNQAISETEAGN